MNHTYQILIPQDLDDYDLDLEDFCGLDINSPLGGKEPVSSIAVQTFPTKVTAVASSFINEYTFVFLGTETGHLKKVIKIKVSKILISEYCYMNLHLH